MNRERWLLLALFILLIIIFYSCDKPQSKIKVIKYGNNIFKTIEYKSGYKFRVYFWVLKNKDTVKQGLYVSYYPNGNTNVKCQFFNNLLIGKAVFFKENGSLYCKSDYDTSEETCCRYFYYPNGNIESILFYFQNSQLGEQKYFTQKGYLDSSSFIYFNKVALCATYDEGGFIKSYKGEPMYLHSNKGVKISKLYKQNYFVFTKPNYITNLNLVIKTSANSLLLDTNIQSFDSFTNTYYYSFRASFHNTGLYKSWVETSVYEKRSNTLIMRDTITENILVTN